MKADVRAEREGESLEECGGSIWEEVKEGRKTSET